MPVPPACAPLRSTTAAATVASSYREFTQYFPSPAGSSTMPTRSGRRSSNTGDVVRRDQRARRDRHHEPARDCRGLDRSTSEPLHRALVWQDRRTADYCANSRADGLLPEVRSAPGLSSTPTSRRRSSEWLLTEGGSTVSATGGRHHRQLGWSGSSPVAPFMRPMPPTPAAPALRHPRARLERRMLDAFDDPSHILPEVRTSSGSFGSQVQTPRVAPASHRWRGR